MPEKELTKEEWQKGLRILAEKAVTIPPGEKVGRWDRESRIIVIYSVLCALARKSGAPI
jgi:hypothetical protein